MTLPAHSEPSQLEQAQERLALALDRLETAMARAPSPVPDDAGEDAAMIASLRGELDAMRGENRELREANDAALGRIESTLGRLNTMLTD